MRTNLEKWYSLIDELNESSQAFIKQEKIGINLSEEYYHINLFGEISKITVEGVQYKHHSDSLFYASSNPTRAELMKLFDYVHSPISFSRKYIYLYCSEEGDGDFVVSLNDFVVDQDYFKSLADAEEYAKR